ncbi:MAG: LPS export ABC transporter periplasmic protein LptC [Massilia sp.]
MATYVNKRTAHRWRLLWIMLVGLFFALGSFWLLEVMRGEEGGARVSGPSAEPDYIVENFSFVRMSPNGQPRYLVSGARLTHRPVGDVSDIEQPVVHSMTTEHPPMTMHAKRGRVLHQQNQVDLMGSVDVQRPAARGSQPMRLRTEALTVLPDEEIMKTDLPVEMTLGGATVRGTGMLANNATQQVHLANRGHLTYPPRANR